MEAAPLKIGIACFPLIGGSGILATALGSELARRGHEVHFFSYAQPVQLELPSGVFISTRWGWRIIVCFTLRLHLAVGGENGGGCARARARPFHVHYAVPHAGGLSGGADAGSGSATTHHNAAWH